MREEGGRGDFLFEVGTTDDFGARWGTRRRLQQLPPHLIVESAQGHVEIAAGHITATVKGRAISVREQM